MRQIFKKNIIFALITVFITSNAIAKVDSVQNSSNSFKIQKKPSLIIDAGLNSNNFLGINQDTYRYSDDNGEDIGNFYGAGFQLALLHNINSKYFIKVFSQLSPFALNPEFKNEYGTSQNSSFNGLAEVYAGREIKNFNDKSFLYIYGGLEASHFNSQLQNANFSEYTNASFGKQHSGGGSILGFRLSLPFKDRFLIDLSLYTKIGAYRINELESLSVGSVNNLMNEFGYSAVRVSPGLRAESWFAITPYVSMNYFVSLESPIYLWDDINSQQSIDQYFHFYTGLGWSLFL